MEKYWITKTPITPEADKTLSEYPPIFRQLLYNRGIYTGEQAKEYTGVSQRHQVNAQNLLGIDLAADRIRSAIQGHQAITIYGDYDVDGVTATALLLLLIRELGGQVNSYIPDRFTEGYGLNKQALSTLAERGTRLVITVDCGIRSLGEASHAARLGLDMIITDHHSPGAELPEALAIINPKQAGDTYSNKDLAGVGLAYKLAMAILETQAGTAGLANSYLDLVALGTVADLAPLKDENRFLVKQGLAYLSPPRRQGIQSLKNAARLTRTKMRAEDIGFVLGPRLNAAGRLGSADQALRLLVSDNIAITGPLAQTLDDLNRKRQKITRENQEVAEAQILEADPNPMLLFAANPIFNQGVVGLVASRLLNRFYRPAIVAHQGPENTRGSCRSIPELNITAALDECADLLIQYGGHAAAAGFTVSNEKLDALANRLQKITAAKLADMDLKPTLEVDLEVQFSSLNRELLNNLEGLQPTGAGNPEAIFISRGLKITKARVVGRDSSHLKMTVTDGTRSHDAIAFRQAKWIDHRTELIDLVYTFETNEFNGNTYLQLNVKDIKLA